MRFYSGFALKDDAQLFQKWLDQSEYAIAGFSYGAIKAFERAYMTKERVERLQLFSPAFFQTKKERFIQMQLDAYSSNKESYIKQFMNNCFFPAQNDYTQAVAEHTLEGLKELLYYEWSREKLSSLKDRGVEIDVYLGEKDKIIDSYAAFEFFSSFATVYYMKECGHFLKA